MSRSVPIPSPKVCLAHDHVSRIYRDSHGFLWICTDEGLSRFDGLRFLNYTVADGLPHIHVNDIVETRGGEYWVGTDGGLTLFRPAGPARRFTVFKPDGPPEALFTNAVLEEPDGAVLVGTGAGLYRLHPKSAVFERLEYPIPAGQVQSAAVHIMYRAPDQTLWIGATTGLYRRDPSGAWLRLGQRDGLPHDVVHHLEPDLEGRIWVCTPHGLARLDRTIEAGRRAVDLVLTDGNGLPSRDVRSILFAPDGRRWIATLGGLVEWLSGPPAPHNFRVYSTGQGLTDCQVYALATDVAGDLWIGTRRGGIMRIVRTGFQTFGPADGLVTTGTDRIIESPSGGICIAAIEDTRRTLRCFDGRRFHVILPRLPAAVTRRLPNSNHTAIFDHQGKWWVSTGNGLYRFPGGEALRKSAVSPDLSLPGAYRFLFEDSHRDMWITTLADPLCGLTHWGRETGRLTDLSASLPDAIRHQGATVLAEAPDGVLWIGLTRPGGLFRFREGRFERVNSAPAGTVQALYRDHAGRLWIASGEGGLGRIDDPAAERVAVRVYDRDDDIGASLSRIAAITEAVKNRVAGSDSDSQRMLSTIAQTSRESVGAMSDIVWSLDPRREDLGDVIARLRAFGSDVLESRGIRWTCEGPPEARVCGLTTDQRRQFFLICKEAIHNIARHSRAENATLRIALDSNVVTCDIQDDGRGIPPGHREGLGIGSMRRRAAGLGGEFRISPRPDGGTQVALHFPLHSRNA